MGKDRDKLFEKYNLYFGLLLIFSCASFSKIEGTTVTNVQPDNGSQGGSTRLTIFGTGFSGNQYSQNDDPSVGNRVYLAGSGGDEFACPVHLDGTTENQIMCYSPNGMLDQDYYVKVVVDGVTTPDSNLCSGNPTSNNCKYRPSPSYTPTVTSFSPNSGVPGDFVRFDGQIFTDRYGSNIDVSSNGKYEKLLRVYVGAQDCGLKNGDLFWGLNLDAADSNNGHIICQTKGTSVGFFNASFIVESPYGRSKPDSTEYLMSYKDDIYLYQIYTNITSISPSTGSTAGGLKLRVNINYIEDRAPYMAPKVYIEDTECVVTNVVVDQYLECTVAADPNYSKTYYRGNRGATFEYWTSTTKTSSNIDDIKTLTSSDSGYNTKVIDETYYTNNMTDYVSRMTYFFKPPHTGDYQFELYGDDGAKLIVDGADIVTSTSTWATSTRRRLLTDTLYRLEIIHYQSTGDSTVHLKAKFFDTQFTSAWTGKAEQEMQTISISSTVVDDVQDLTFTGFTTQSHTNEVQQVVVDTQGSFRLGLYGVFTEAIAYEADENTVSTAFNALPIFESGESVTVTRAETSTPTFTFTFTSTRGDFPKIEVRKLLNGAPASGNITQTTRGVPDMNMVALQLETRVSNAFQISTLNANTLTTVVEGMFEAKCPAVFESSSLKKLYLDYESDTGDFGGWRVKDTEPFCGRYSLKNPWALYRTKTDDLTISLSSFPKVCFAYKGVLQDAIYMTFTFTEDGTNEEKTWSRSYSHSFMKDSDTESTTWYYTCHDMYASATSSVSGGSNFRVQRIWVGRGTGNDIFVDSVFIGRSDTVSDDEIHLRRLPPAMPNGAIINTVSVSESSGIYRVTLKPYDCGNNFPVFELANGETKSGSIAKLVGIYGLSNGGAGRMTATRTAFASPPVTGFIDVTFNGNTRRNLNVSLSGPEFQRELESLSGIGSLVVEKSGDCANFDMAVTFMTLPGDLSLMSLSNQLSGIDAASSITGNRDGGLYYDPFLGDMISTVHDQPQVRALVNGVPTSCAGNCSFEWSSSATPTVTGISPSSGTSALSTTAVITGTGFDTNISNNTVTMGGVACTVTAASATSITCDVGNGPVGDHKVIVNVNNKGDGDHGGSDVMFSYVAAITAINPTSGSLGGGQVITLTGYGFKSGAVVTINSNPCVVSTVLPAELVCTAPASSTAGSYDVVVTQGSITLTRSSFTYDLSLTATVSNISPSILTVTGNTVTIDGTSFGNTARTVMIGSQSVTVTSWTDTQIIVETGLLTAGTQELKIYTGSGFAVDGSNAVPTVDVQLTVTNVYPLQGSLQGGTKLTIAGTGFSTNTSLVDVDVGTFDCAVDSVTNTQIVCLIANAGTVHQVTNGGTHSAFGIYYAFDSPYITINKGDFVHWSWTTPDFVNDVVHAIIEVDSPSSTTPKAGGFSSGTPTKNGQFTYQFNSVGTYYVWSGYNDIWSIKNYAGTVEVVEASSSLAEVMVKVSGKEAEYNVGGITIPSDPSSCQSVVSGKSGCTDSLPSGGDSSKFNFAFWTCSTPVITSIDPRNGTTKTTIAITGEGFSTTNCQNEVTIAGAPCEVSSSSATALECKISKTGEPELGVLHPVSLRVGNRGTALVSIMALQNRSFALIPNIDSITPESGSLAGGALLTLSGFGLKDSPLVTVNNYQCPILSSSYTEIVCETPSSSAQQSVNVTATVSVAGSPYPVSCETDIQTCGYLYLRSQTPTLDSISPDATSGALSFTITGTQFGTSTTEVVVTIGGEQATISSVNDTSLSGSIANLPVGDNDVIVKVKDYGKASGSLQVTSNAALSSVTPTSGSIHGETLITLSGNGFISNKTTVSLGGSTCTIQSISLSQVVCRTSAHAAGSVDVVVLSNSISYPTVSFSYSTASTPTIASVSPVSALSGSTLTITGQNLDGTSVDVTLNDVPCTISSKSSTQIVCTLGNHETGIVPVKVYVSNLGVSNTDVNFEYQLQLSSINPTSGGIAGGQTVTLTGLGFNGMSSATICTGTCTLVSHTTTQYVCKTPANSAQVCDVTISVNGLNRSLANAYTYDASLTPTVTSVSPRRGGTGGGTSLTITGSGFGSTLGDAYVSIDGAACVATSVSESQIECLTGQHTGSVSTQVSVEIAGNGIAQEQSSGDANFQYIDVWSSNFTWGGGPLPDKGDFVVIPSGQDLLLDTDTPVLKFLLIQGGRLIFDEKDVELNAEIIMITDQGTLQVGTETNPFQHKGIITLHGHHRSRELPIYGTKVLAVRNGTLDLHGTVMPITWTRLASTAAQGSNTLVLQDPVEWNVGDEVVIAATGHRHTQSENEKKTISAISGDKMTLTLSSPLEAEHVGEQETFNGTLVEFRAEVGLLTHNVVVRGNTDPQWEDEIRACEAGFNTGEFATQTCFLGRFGDEIGSSQFGGMILVHSPTKDTQEALARLSFIEVTFVGQAFRLGRYPIHFHLNGEMSNSYVRGVSIHHAFNRAVNIHGSHNTIVEKTVIYNIMGGAFFLEDGIETGNTFQYNLAVFVRESSSLLNDDITPASFWVTNPNNTIRHNAAAGGTHFGYWYRMHDHPDGPSFTESICPKLIPLGEFYNNSAHSFGWFGLWIFPDYFPKSGGCDGSVAQPAVFRKLFAWNNEKGAEAVNSGALQFEDFVLVQNQKAGYEGKLIIGAPRFTDDSPMIKNSLIVASTTVIANSEQGCTTGGIVLAYGYGFQIKGVRFVNFDSTCAGITWTSIDGTCSVFCGGFTYHTYNLTWENSVNRVRFRWEWEGIVVDRDGTLTGKSEADWKVVPTTGTLPSDCESINITTIGNALSACPPQHVFHRYSFNNPSPSSLEGKDFVYYNSYGNGTAPYRKKAITHPFGWMLALLSGATYKFEFKNAEHMTNMSWTGKFYEFESDDYLMVTVRAKEFPDRISVDGGQTYINATVGSLDPLVARYGDWAWDGANNEMTLMIHGTARSKRDVSVSDLDPSMNFVSYKCFYKDCIPPPDPDLVAPQDRPADFHLWDATDIWNDTQDGYITNDQNRNSTYGVPQALDNVKITYQSWIIINTTSISKLGTLLLEGVLEVMDTPGANYTLDVNFIIIRGGRLVIGTPSQPFQALANIIVRGSHSTPSWNDGEDGPTVGSKAIAVFGGLDLHGKDKGITWTKLASTANAGSNQLTLVDAVGWEIGDEIVLGPTSYNVWETESFKITAISADNKTLTVNDTLMYKHIAHSETINGQVLQLGAAVGLLTHNIKIIGEDYPQMYSESCGARVLVGLVIHRGQTYTGYARFSNVEFYHTGQEGYFEPYDPRFSVAYVATGTVSDLKPSNISKCSFHNGFNTAIGAFGIGGLNITDNVVFGSIGHALRTTSDDTRMINNMVSLVVWTGSYQDRAEPFNFFQEAAIEAIGAKRLILKDNLVTGGERFGFHVPPYSCDDTANNYTNNIAQANVIGVGILPNDEQPSGSCLKYENFIAWKNLDYGIYFQGSASFVAENNVVIENGNGYHIHVFGPHALSHQTSNKTIEIRDGMVVGATSSFDCALDVARSTVNLALRLSGSGRASNGGKIGITFGNFMGGSNNAPIKPWAGIKTYPAISGLMKLKNLTFAHFNPSSCNGDYAIATSPGNDDGQHPVEAEQIIFHNVNENNKVSYHRPNVGKINGADCVDMDCDAMKKALLKDLDGTFLGSIGAVIPQSEYEWDGDPRRGLGDYRIPKEMVTTLTGTRILYDSLAPNKGIYRGQNCTYMSAWTAYKCFGDNYEMLIIESMDDDTETRRLSPVAIAANPFNNGYIDLINGPQDHGWCSGYTCRKRVSTFMAIVATGLDYLLHFTSTTPEHLRYHLLNVEDDEGILLKVWYSRSNRLDVYVNSIFILPINGRIDSDGNYIISQLPEGDQYLPNVTNPAGTNFIDHIRGELTIIIKGSLPIDVITKPTIIVSFSLPALTVEQFFGDNIIENMAAFLGVPLTKVRIANAVNEQSGRRRKRNTGIVVTVEISDEPSSTLNVTVPNSLTYEELLLKASQIVNECQAGNVSATLNITGSCQSVTVPPVNLGETEVTYSTPSPDRLIFHAAPQASYEGKPLQIQPVVHAVDIGNVAISQLGTTEYPWQLSVEIRSGTGHASAVLGGTTTVNATNGWFNFMDLSISLMGTGYILDFKVIYPSVAENFTLASSAFDVAGRPLRVNMKMLASGNKIKDSPFAVTLNLQDVVTSETISDIVWRSHTWSVTAKLLGSPRYGGLQGMLTTNFDPLTGEAMYTDLAVTGVGVYYIQFNVVSTPPDYNLTLNQKVITRRPSHSGLMIQESNEIRLRFNVDYYSLLATTDLENGFEQYFMEILMNEYAPNVVVTSTSIAPGSIVVTFVIAGNTSDVNSTAYTLCDSILNETSYSYNGYTLTLAPFMTVNNQTYYGVTCGSIESDDDDDLSTGVIVGIALGGAAIILLIVIIGLLLWKNKVKPNTKTHDNTNGHYTSNKMMDDSFFRDDSFLPMKGSKVLPPAGTNMMSNKGPQRRPASGMSTISVHLETPEPPAFNSKTETWNGHRFQRPGSVALPPPYLESEATYIEPHDKEGMKRLRSPSPALSSGSSTLHGRLTPFDDRDSPLPPVGHDLYNTDYVMSPIPRSTTPHLPAPSPKPSHKKL